MHPLLQINCRAVEGAQLGGYARYHAVDGGFVLLEIGDIVGWAYESPLEAIPFAVALGEEVERVGEVWHEIPVHTWLGQGCGHFTRSQNRFLWPYSQDNLLTIEFGLFKPAHRI